MKGTTGRRLAKYLAIAFLPTLLLLHVPIVNFAVLALGERVLLETEPVDPRDLLRGDYVELDYRISNIPKNLVPESFGEVTRKGHTAYVVLQKDAQGVAEVVGVSPEPSGGLYLKGTLRTGWGSGYTCDYGLGVYYVPEGTGRALEEAIREASVFADVRVLRGRGVIKTLEVKR